MLRIGGDVATATPRWRGTGDHLGPFTGPLGALDQRHPRRRRREVRCGPDPSRGRPARGARSARWRGADRVRGVEDAVRLASELVYRHARPFPGSWPHCSTAAVSVPGRTPWRAGAVAGSGISGPRIAPTSAAIWNAAGTGPPLFCAPIRSATAAFSARSLPGCDVLVSMVIARHLLEAGLCCCGLRFRARAADGGRSRRRRPSAGRFGVMTTLDTAGSPRWSDRHRIGNNRAERGDSRMLKSRS